VESEPQRLDDMSEEELEVYAKENDIDISELKEATTEVEPGDIAAKSEEVVESTEEVETKITDKDKKEASVTPGERKDFKVGDKFYWDFVGEVVEVSEVDSESVSWIDPRNGRNRKAGKEGVLNSINNPRETVYSEIEEATTDTTTEDVVTEGDTFTQEELDQEITKDNLQSTIDKIDSLQKKIRSTTKSDLGFSAALDAVLTLTKAALKTTKTFRDAYNSAVAKFKNQDGYKKLTDEQKNKLDSFSETEFTDALKEESEKAVERGDTFNKAKEAYKKARESNLDTKESALESFKTVERADWYKSLSKEDQQEIKADFVNRLVPNFESEGKAPKKNRKGIPKLDESKKLITTEKQQLKKRLIEQRKGS